MAVISVQSSGGYASFFQGVTTRFDGLTTSTCLRDTQVKEVTGNELTEKPSISGATSATNNVRAVSA